MKVPSFPAAIDTQVCRVRIRASYVAGETVAEGGCACTSSLAVARGSGCDDVSVVGWLAVGGLVYSTESSVVYPAHTPSDV